MIAGKLGEELVDGESGEEHEKLLNLRHLKYLLINPIFIAKWGNGNDSGKKHY